MNQPPARFRVEVAALRLLGWANGLEGWLSLLAGVWGVSVLIDQDWWNAYWSKHTTWPLTTVDLAYVLIATSAGALVALWRKWRWLRMQSSVIAFMAWAMLSVYEYLIPPEPPTQALVTHILCAIGELGVYVRIMVGLDQRGNQLDGLLRRHNETGE